MKAFLGNSPWRKKGYYGVRAGSRWPHFESVHQEYMPFPFFLAYAAAVLEEADHQVLLVDGIAEGISQKDFISRAVSFGPELIVLEVSTISIDTDLSLVEELRKNFGKEIKIALAGLHAYMYEKPFLSENPDVDFVLVGEYEHTLKELVMSLEKSGPLAEVPGLIFRDKKSEIVANQRRPLISNLDDLPWPARHHLPMENYHDEPGNIPRPSVQMLASRGCPFGCVFCAWPQIIYNSRQYRTRDPVDVVDEFEWLVKDWGFKSVYFDDDTFNIGRKRVLEICDLITQRRLDTPWAAMCRADTMSPDMLEAMVDAGLHAVKFGVEASDQEILKTAGKALNLRKVKETVRLTHEMGIKTHLTFMFGLPGETQETAQRTIDLALALNPESVQFTIATPFPGSRFYRELDEQGFITSHNFSQYDGFRSAVVKTASLSSRDLERIAENANDRWKRHVFNRRPISGSKKDDCFVSVIIPNFNGKAFLEPCLESLEIQKGVEKEVILVDNASDDDSVEFVRAKFPWVIIIALKKNTGFAGAVNRGIEQAKGDFVAVLNNDTTVEFDWLEKIWRFLKENPDIGFCASKIVAQDDTERLDSLGHGITRGGYTFNMGHGIIDSNQNDKPEEVFGAPAAGAVYRKTMLEDIGSFDEDFFMYLEDVDLSFRARLWGYKAAVVPGAVVHHAGAGTSGSQYHKRNVYHLARNSIYVLLKNMPRELLKTHYLRIFGFFIYLQMYHTFRTFHGWSCMKGLYHGIRDSKKMVVKRKRILGGKRVTDEHLCSLLVSCEEKYRHFKKMKNF